MRAIDSSTTVWANSSLGRGSPKLLFGWTHEDAGIELEAFAGLRRVFCIAGAGCTAMALASDGHDVTAVDINPCQVEYAKARAEGAPARPGAAERLVARGRSLLPLLGWRRATVREFLSLDDTREQTEFWDQHLDTRRWRAALNVLLAPRLLALAYAAPLLAALPPDFDAVIRERLRRGWAAHPNRLNPYAWRLLAGEDKFAPVRAASRNSRPITFACADAAGFLESSPPASFDAFSLSNIVDGASPAYIDRLAAAVRRAAAPPAMLVTRSFAEPRDLLRWPFGPRNPIRNSPPAPHGTASVSESDVTFAPGCRPLADARGSVGRCPAVGFSTLSSAAYPFNIAARDRSLLWGSVDVRPATEF